MKGPMENQERPTRGRPRDPDLARRRRETILRQAVLHFASLGFDKADVAAIAASAGCSKGTVYNYFSSKRELFREAVDHVMDGLLEATRNPEAEESIEAFKFAVESFLSYFTEHPEYIELLIQERAYFKDRKDPSYLEYREQHCLRKRERFQSLIDRGVFRAVPPGPHLGSHLQPPVRNHIQQLFLR